MTAIESISMFQRMVNSIKNDVEALGPLGFAVKGKLELLEGEMGVFRKVCEEILESEAAKD